MSRNRARLRRPPRSAVAIAAVLVVAAATLAGCTTNDAEPSDATSGARVLVSTRNIPSGVSVSTVLASPGDWVEVVEVPRDVMLPDAVAVASDLDRFAGAVFSTSVRTGGQIRSSSLVVPGTQVSAIEAPVDSFEISFAVDPDDLVGGLIRPGHEVAAIGTFAASFDNHAVAITVAEGLLVTDVRALELPNPEQADAQQPDPLSVALIPATKMLVTVAVDIVQAERLVFTAENGSLTFLLQGEDADALASRGVNWWSLRGSAAPPLRDTYDVDRSLLSDNDLQSAAPPSTSTLSEPEVPAPTQDGVASDGASSGTQPEQPLEAEGTDAAP